MPAGVGRTLRDARVLAGIQLSDVHAQTGIRPKYLRALEWERFDLLPSFEYARRAAQAEARVLSLDADATLDELNRTIATVPKHGPTIRGQQPPAPEVVAAPTQGVVAPPTQEVVEPAPPVRQAPPGVDPTPVFDEPSPAPPTATPDARPSVESTTPQRWPEPPGDRGSRDSLWPSPGARRLLIYALLGGLAAFLIVDLLVFRDDGSSSEPPAASQPTATGETPTAPTSAPAGPL